MGQQARRTVEPLALDRYIAQLCEVYDGAASKEGSARRA
jgi:hypothetical protein